MHGESNRELTPEEFIQIHEDSFGKFCLNILQMLRNHFVSTVENQQEDAAEIMEIKASFQKVLKAKP